MEISHEERKMLHEAIQRAQKLVNELTAQQAEMEQNPTAIPPADLRMGREAMNNAMASARRMLQALYDAQEIANRDLADSDEL